jgi:hypothetical protein
MHCHCDFVTNLLSSSLLPLRSDFTLSLDHTVSVQLDELGSLRTALLCPQYFEHTHLGTRQNWEL